MVIKKYTSKRKKSVKHCSNPYCFKNNSVRELVVVYLSWPVDLGYKKILSKQNKSIRKNRKNALAGKHFSKKKWVRGISWSEHSDYKKTGSVD